VCAVAMWWRRPAGLQIFGMAQQEMEYRVDLFNKWVFLTERWRLSSFMSYSCHLLPVNAFQGFREYVAAELHWSKQASKLPSRQVIDKQGGSVQADADMVWQVRWKKVRAHNLVCSCENISFVSWYCVVGVLLLHFCLSSPTHLY
jgi:hypothetical protein